MRFFNTSTPVVAADHYCVPPLEQTRAYMDRCAASAGHLVIFDRTDGKPWSHKVFCTETAAGVPVTVWGM